MDLIERQAAIDIFDDYNVSVENGELEAYSRDRKRLCDLPSAKPEQRWISVSERLPEVGRSVLFSRRSMSTREGCLQADGEWWQYRWNEMLNADQVTAWMPLPEPYLKQEHTMEEFMYGQDMGNPEDGSL